MKSVLFCLLVLATGCKTYDLGDEWKPLEQIKASSVAKVAGIEGVDAVTVGDTVYVADLDSFLDALPQPLLDAQLKHEQVHAVRQAKDGVYKWIALYATDTKFMRNEEFRGWYEQIKHLQNLGKDVSPEAVGKAMAKYENLKGAMISAAEATEWVRAVLSGAWKPPAE